MSTREGGGPDAAAVERCASLLENLLEIVHTDWLSIPADVASSSRPSKFGTTSTVGLMLNDLTIHRMVVGGPAFTSRQLQLGDRVVSVDGSAVGLDDYEAALVGSDIPGTEVILTVHRESEDAEIDVSLRRMARAEMAHHVDMFEHFTTIENLAANGNEPELSPCIKDTVRLWTTMRVAAANRDNRTHHKMTTVQNGCRDIILALQQDVAKLRTPLRIPSNVEAKAKASSMQEFLQDCERICAELKKSLAADILSLNAKRHHQEDWSPIRTAVTTIGVMMNGLSVQNMILGSPAYTCHRLDRGDQIVKVDGVEVTPDTFAQAVIGCDVPVMSFFFCAHFAGAQWWSSVTAPARCASPPRTLGKRTSFSV